MNRARPFLAAIALVLATLVQGLGRAAGQEIADAHSANVVTSSKLFLPAGHRYRVPANTRYPTRG